MLRDAIEQRDSGFRCVVLLLPDGCFGTNCRASPDGKSLASGGVPARFRLVFVETMLAPLARREGDQIVPKYPQM